MELNVKIKDYKRSFGSSPFVDYHNHLGKIAVFPNSEEERKMTERFTELHWQAQNVLYLKDHDDRMFALQQHNYKILGNFITFSTRVKSCQDVDLNHHQAAGK